MNNLCYGCMQQKKNNDTICPACGYTNGQEHEEHYYLQEGTVLFQRYIVGKVLGHGGFGITYIGFDQKLHIRVAIKEYLPSDVATRSEGQSIVKTFSGEKKEQYEYGLNRFLDEARTLAKYNNNPCIVSTSDFFEENNTAYIVMEFLDGISLAEYLNRKGGKISWDETIEIMSPIMDALNEVHKSGMIHRDISPDNIYITKTGQVKLIDFGAARFALGEKSKSLSVVLKPGYAPPEQYSSKGRQGTWTDVYSLSATIYRCLEGKKIDDAMDRMIDNDLKMLEVPIEYRTVIAKALSTLIEERIQDVHQLLKAFNKQKSEQGSITTQEDSDSIDKPNIAKEGGESNVVSLNENQVNSSGINVKIGVLAFILVASGLQWKAIVEVINQAYTKGLWGMYKQHLLIFLMIFVVSFLDIPKVLNVMGLMTKKVLYMFLGMSFMVMLLPLLLGYGETLLLTLLPMIIVQFVWYYSKSLSIGWFISGGIKIYFFGVMLVSDGSLFPLNNEDIVFTVLLKFAPVMLISLFWIIESYLNRLQYFVASVLVLTMSGLIVLQGYMLSNEVSVLNYLVIILLIIITTITLYVFDNKVIKEKRTKENHRTSHSIIILCIVMILLSEILFSVELLSRVI